MSHCQSPRVHLLNIIYRPTGVTGVGGVGGEGGKCPKRTFFGGGTLGRLFYLSNIHTYLYVVIYMMCSE